MKPILALYGIQDRYEHQYPGYTHDHNLTVMRDGQIENYLHLERLTRRKNDNRLSHFIEEIIDSNLDLSESFELVNVNSFVGSSFISKTGRLRIDSNTPMRISTQAEDATAWFQRNQQDGFAPNTQIISHELAHIFSCLPFYGDFKENSLLVHFDGGASVSNFSAFQFKDNKLSIVEYHWDLSHLSKIFNDNALSFALMKANSNEHCSVPGKLMGYAAMGSTSSDMEKWLSENDLFKDIWQNQDAFYDAAQNWNWNGDLANNDDPFLMNVAAGLQTVFQKGIIKKLKELQQKTKTEYLYYTGGCALNICTNSAIIRSGFFKDVFIPPACNDSGLSLGAAAYVNWARGKKAKKHDAYLNNLQQQSTFTYTAETIKQVAADIIEGKVIGICNGKGEAGPRALGNRSIIARPDSKSIAQKVSMECKEREWFRPIAPVMLERNARKVISLGEIHHLSRFMLLDFRITEEYITPLSGIVHKNGTARIQTLFDKKDNPFLHDLLEYLDVQHGVIALINTSFNKRGNPIVEMSEDALNEARELNLDEIIINGKYQRL